MLAHLSQVILKTQHILPNKSTALRSLWTKDLGTIVLLVVQHLPDIFTPSPGTPSNHSENFHTTRVFTREALSLFLVRLKSTIYKEDSSGTWSQMVVKQPRIRSGFPAVTRGHSTQPTRGGPSEAHVDALTGATWNQSWTEDSRITFNKIRSKQLKNFLTFFNFWKCFIIPFCVLSLKMNCITDGRTVRW